MFIVNMDKYGVNGKNILKNIFAFSFLAKLSIFITIRILTEHAVNVQAFLMLLLSENLMAIMNYNQRFLTLVTHLWFKHW